MKEMKMGRLLCAKCGMPTIEDIHDDVTPDENVCNKCYEELEIENEGGSIPPEHMQEELVRWMTEGTDPDMSPRSDCG